ncbi:MAG: secondary thiamine-phosphate synthase enzyme YjbQ [Halothece sp. Uz-M2-17]|nr:secondary thiamine-phosphate synthase enzyme YjbQ [Halothece sp. Uz-M2-17]
MSHYQTTFTVKTTGKCLHKITSKIESIVAQSGVERGLCTVFIRHTSASLIIQENADPDVLTDLSNFLKQLVPEDRSLYVHNAEGPDDMPAHIRSVLTKTSEQIPIDRGQLMLGTWQGIYLWEHRDRAHSRELVVHISGN